MKDSKIRKFRTDKRKTTIINSEKLKFVLFQGSNLLFIIIKICIENTHYIIMFF